MEWLNYHHLLYFWVVAREGSIVRAAKVLHLSHPTISAQIRALEGSLGEPLFRRVGRRLVLTDVGRVVLRYADEIFATGRELLDTVRGRPSGRPMRLVVGVSNVLPKLVVRRLLEPIRGLDVPVRLVVRDDKPERLFADLSQHMLDVVLSDAPIGSASAVRAHSHLLGDCGVAFFAGRRVAARMRRRFPGSLDGAPVLLATEGSTLRRSIDTWFEKEGIRPVVVAEFDDSALLKSFAEGGWGAFPAPTVVTPVLRRQYGVLPMGVIPDLRERFYAITVERRIKNPAVAVICEKARTDLFP
ncbi:MAG: transcriptional activator NhaR [bacterium]